MTPKELADLLNGREIGEEITREEAKVAKVKGLVVVFGASDDLMEFKGAIDEEIGAYEGAVAIVDPTGLSLEWEEIEDRDRNDIDFMRDWFKREGTGKTIEALWCKTDACSWTFETSIPYETFDIMEDGELYCRGIVFRLADAGS